MEIKRDNCPEPLVHYHLPGLFEFYEFYREFLPLYRAHREYFYEWCNIGSIYGAPADCLWGGGRVGVGEASAEDVLALLSEYGISARLTFSNSQLRPEHLADPKCNALCAMFDEASRPEPATALNDTATGESPAKGATARGSATRANGIILHSDLLLYYVEEHYPHLRRISSTTKVLTVFGDFRRELQRPEYDYVVPDFRLNKQLEKLDTLSSSEKAKVEFLCNECCYFGCADRYECYETVSRQNLGEDCSDHVCTAPNASEGYRFSAAMRNPGFISVEDIQTTYAPRGFSDFKIEGRGLGSAVLLESLLYYMTKTEHQLEVREALYLDSMLDLF